MPASYHKMFLQSYHGHASLSISPVSSSKQHSKESQKPAAVFLRKTERDGGRGPRCKYIFLWVWGAKWIIHQTVISLHQLVRRRVSDWLCHVWLRYSAHQKKSEHTQNHAWQHSEPVHTPLHTCLARHQAHILTAALLNSWQHVYSLNRVRLVNWSLQHTHRLAVLHTHIQNMWAGSWMQGRRASHFGCSSYCYALELWHQVSAEMTEHFVTLTYILFLETLLWP